MKRARVLFAVLAASLILVGLAGTPVLVGQDAGAPLASGLASPERSFRDPTRVTALGYEAAYAFAGHVDLDPAEDALVIVAPSTEIEEQEVRRVHAFLRAGGRVLVADSGPMGARFLEQLGAGVQLGTTPVYTPAFQDEPHRVVTLSTGRLPGLPDETLLPRPVLVSGGEPLLVTSELAWLDANANGRPDLDESLTRGAVAARASVGSGALIVVGSPRAVTAGGDAAAAFLAAVTEDGARRLVLDESHHVRSDPYGVNAVVAGQGGAVVGTGILILSFALVVVVALGPRVRPERPRPRASRFDARGTDPALLREVLRELDRR